MAKKNTGSNKRLPDKATPVDEGKLLSIRYAESELGLFANHMIAQNSGTEFHLSFFQLHPPILTGDQDEVNDALKNIESVVAKPVARIIVPAVLLPSIVEVLQKQFSKLSQEQR